MKVRELVEQLSKFNPEQEVCLYNEEQCVYQPVLEISAIYEPIVVDLSKPNPEAVFAVYLS